MNHDEFAELLSKLYHKFHVWQIAQEKVTGPGRYEVVAGLASEFMVLADRVKSTYREAHEKALRYDEAANFRGNY